MMRHIALLMGVEVMRLKRHRSDWLVLLLLAAITLAAAWWAGMAAADLRAQSEADLAQWQQGIEARQILAQRDPAARGAIEEYTAELARRHAPPAQLEAGGGLVLSVRQFDVLTPDIRVSTQPRYSDGRFSDQVFNPLLQELGLLDLGTLIALLLPLAIIAMGYGLVQEAREQGIWRLVCAQNEQPWLLLLIALLLRWLVVFVVVALASALAFVLDPGATLGAALGWLLAVALYGLFWTLLLAVLAATPLSSGGSATASLGIWVLLTFMLPVVLAWGAERSAPMPSRLVAVIELRDAQESVGERTDALTAQWYASHAEHAAVSGRAHTRFVNNVQRDLLIDDTVRQTMLGFESARAAQLDYFQSRAWLTPGVGLLAVADALAGIDAGRYLHYVQAVNRFEDEWRDFFVPRIMSYGGVAIEDYDRLPQFSGLPPAAAMPPPGLLLRILLPILLAAGVIFMVRRRLGRP